MMPCGITSSLGVVYFFCHGNENKIIVDVASTEC